MNGEVRGYVAALCFGFWIQTRRTICDWYSCLHEQFQLKYLIVHVKPIMLDQTGEVHNLQIEVIKRKWNGGNSRSTKEYVDKKREKLNSELGEIV